MTTATERTQMVAWFALLTAFIALFVAAVAFQQVSAIQQSFSQTQPQGNAEQTAIENARLKLEKLRTDVSIGAINVDVQKELTDIRKNLGSSLSQRNQTIQDAGESLDKELDVIQQNLRRGTVSALAAIDQMIQKLQDAVKQ